MGRGDVRRALQAMDDEGVRQRLAAGDFSAVPGLALDEHEKDLVRGAAAEYPEVAGFSFDTFMKIGDIKGEAGVSNKWSLLESIKLEEAIKYAGG